MDKAPQPEVTTPAVDTAQAKENGQGILTASGVERPRDPDNPNTSDHELARHYGVEIDGGM